MNHQRIHYSSEMYFSADSPAFTNEESFVNDNNNKSFDSYSSDLYEMDSELSYQELFNTMNDQAVPDFLSVNTPVTSAASFPNMSSTSLYMPEFSGPSVFTSDKSYMTSEPPSYYSHPNNSWSTVPTAPTHIPVQPTIAEQTSSRGPVIMESTTPEQKPRRKGGRKPKNDPLPPHLEERRRLRRIRNKEAAQKCRERRLEHTDKLMREIDNLENETRYYEDVINKLREFKEQCEFMLNSHKSNCNKNSKRTLISSRPFNQLDMSSCSIAHRRSSSSEGDLHSPTLIL